MITLTPSAQLVLVDSSTVPSANGPMPPGGGSIICPNGVLIQDVTLEADTDEAPAFPMGVTTALVLYVLAVTATDLTVNIVGTATELSVPVGQALTLFNVTAEQVTFNSVLGGKIWYVIGG